MVILMGIYDGSGVSLPVGDKNVYGDGTSKLAVNADAAVQVKKEFGIKYQPADSSSSSQTYIVAEDDLRGNQVGISFDVGYFYVLGSDGISDTEVIIDGGTYPTVDVFVVQVSEGKVDILTPPGDALAVTQGNGNKLVQLDVTADDIANDIFLAIFMNAPEESDTILNSLVLGTENPAQNAELTTIGDVMSGSSPATGSTSVQVVTTAEGGTLKIESI